MERRELMVRTLSEIGPYVGRLAEGCTKINDCFLDGRRREGVEMLQEFVDGLAWVFEGLRLTMAVQEERGVVIDLTRLSKIMPRLNEKLEKQDFETAGEVLLDDFQPLLDEWFDELVGVEEAGGNPSAGKESP